MKILTGFTDSARQYTVLLLEDGTQANLFLEYRPQQKGWFYDLEYKAFVLKGQRLVSGENILRQFVHQLPFGLAVMTDENAEPFKQDAFSSGRTTFILLTPAEASLVETNHFSRND